MNDEGVLDPWVADWLEHQFGGVMVDLASAAREGIRAEFPAPPRRELAEVCDDVVEGVPVRLYRTVEPPTGVLAYFHGGGFCAGSVAAMDAFARELAHHSGALVASVEYRLSPEHPYPAALDDCETVTRWAVANPRLLDVPAGRVALAGESAGGNLAAAVTLRLRELGAPKLAGQVLMYPSLDGAGSGRASEIEFDGLIIDRATSRRFWEWYTSGRDLDRDPFAVPLSATSLRDLPRALVVLGGCDSLRDAGRAYSARLRDDGVDVTETCYPGQPHGFMNFMFPAAPDAFAEVGTWLRVAFAHAPGQAR